MRHILVHDNELAEQPLLVYDLSSEHAAQIDGDDGGVLRSLRIRSRQAQIYRLDDSQSMRSSTDAAKLHKPNRESDASSHDWRLEHVSEPDVSDKETVLSLAKMSSDAYLVDEKAPDWLNSSADFNRSSNFGWQDNRLRGHVFADAENKTVVIAIKGTSAG